MSKPGIAPRVQAQRLLRWYPAEWRARYGDEFGELLASEIIEEPRSLHRHVDVAIGGLLARLAAAGLSGTPVNASDQPQRSLVTFGCVLAAFMTVAASIWSQLNIARTSAPPAASATDRGILIMTVALFTCLATVAVGGAPLAWKAAKAVWGRRGAGLRGPALLLTVGAAVLIVGGLHYRGGWAGSTAHPGADQGMAPGILIAVMWASTLAVSAYWAHPSVLLGFPPSEIAWMIISPLALVAMVTGAAQSARRLEFSARLLRFTRSVAKAASLGLGLFLLGNLIWLVDGGPGPNNQFRAGTVNLVGLAVMILTLALAIQSIRRADRRGTTAGAVAAGGPPTR